MKRYRNQCVVMTALTLLMLSACGKEDTSSTPSTEEDMTIVSEDDMSADMVQQEADMAADMVGEEDLEDMGEIAEDMGTEEVDQSDAEITYIHLEGDSISIEGNADAVTVEGTLATITSPGVYRIDGTLDDGAIAVESPDDGEVYMQLDGIEVKNSKGSPLYVLDADDVIIELLEGTESKLEDSADYTFPDPTDDEPNATLFSKDDMVIKGAGSLSIIAHYNDGLSTKNDLDLELEGTLSIVSVDDGIRGKDSITITSGNYIIEAGGDGLKSDEDDDEEKGFIQIDGGEFEIVAGGDAVQAERVVTISAGAFELTAGGGSNAQLGEDDSAKGLKAGVKVEVQGGIFVLDCADDAVHSDDTILISGGELEISSGDDGVHADLLAQITDGLIVINQAYEGIESEEVIIDGGQMYMTTSDDGLNGAGGESSSGGFGPPGGGGSGSNYQLTINGGYVVIDALGDGVDANGNIDMTGGTVIVHGPSTNMNGALDYDSNFAMTGGVLIATGSSRMAQAPSASGTTQAAMLLNLTSSRGAGEIFHIEGPSGEDILSFAPIRSYQSVAFSSPALEVGASYTYYAGGSHTGVEKDGLYTGGEYTPGTQLGTVTTSSLITQVGSRGGR